jgi:hypothetical protein
VYIADTGNQVIRKISNGMVTTVAGTLTDIEPDEYYRQSGFEDGYARYARFSFPRGLYYAEGMLFIADAGNHAVRVLVNGTVYTLAGGGEGEYIMNQPLAVVYRNGVVFVADSLNHTIRMLEMTIGG